MRHRIFFIAGASATIMAGWFPLAGAAAAENIKLPYEVGQRFVVVQGYDTPPTHIKKDLFALDLSQNGCDAYGKLAVAATAGQVMLAQQSGYNGGYGTQVLVVNNSHTIARYAHLIPDTVTVAPGDAVVQGEPLGKIGDTGLVVGAACPTHPGTHLHFAMYSSSTDGSFLSFFPEPISNYTNITAGKWYLSDNGIALATIPGALAFIEQAAQKIAGDIITSRSTTVGMSGANATAPAGGVSAATISMPASSVSLAPDVTTNSPSSTVVSATPTMPTASVAFNTSTLALDLSWPPILNASGSPSSTVYSILKIDPANASNTIQVGITTSTHFSYSLSDADVGTKPQFAIESIDGLGNIASLSTIQTIPVSLPDWFTQTIIQPIDNANSNGSWYGDNWYNLGTGFYGTIRSLMLEGFIDNTNYFASQLWLDEYLDPDYTELNQTFPVSNNAPFTAGLQKITIADLNIPLQPNKYYRLRTYQDYQNRSVVLAGTIATGTAMWNEFIYGTGRVEHTYAFYPYLAMRMIPNYPPLDPPDLVPNITIAFDQLNSMVNFSWPAATDPDTTSSLLTYQVNVASSTALDNSQWHSVGKSLSASVPVVFGNTYTIGVRAVDDLGNIGAPSIESWQFPAGYVATPQQLDHSTGLPGGSVQKLMLVSTTTIAAINLWTQPEPGDASCCDQSFVSLHADIAGSPGDEIASTTPITLGRFGDEGERSYQFSTPIMLPAGSYWFTLHDGPANPTNDTAAFGSAGPDQKAYFRIMQAF